MVPVIAARTEKFPVLCRKFPVTALKIPVPLHREFLCKALNLLSERRENRLARPDSAKFPVNFPFGVPNPRLQAKRRVDEVALCDDIDLAATRSTTSRFILCGAQNPQAGADGRGGDPSSRSSAADCGGEISYRAHQNISQIVQWLKGTSSRVLLQEFPHLKKQYWGRHLWARGYFAVTSDTITDEMINEYINEQEGEALQDDSRFEIDPS